MRLPLINMNLSLSFLITASLVLSSSFAVGQATETVLFEGYSKITSSTSHIGYIISRYSFDPKAKHFKALTFMKINIGSDTATETLSAISTDTFAPVKYTYNFAKGADLKSITADFAKGLMTGTSTEGGTTKKISQKIKDGSFLSGFLVYMMLKSPSGIQTGSKYNYLAVAEEDGKLYGGESVINKKEKYAGFELYRIENKFKFHVDVEKSFKIDFNKSNDLAVFSSLVSEKGEVFLVESPMQGLRVELMAKPQDAVANHGLSAKLLTELFGEVPLGTNNSFSQSIKPPELKGATNNGTPPDATSPMIKGADIPPGQGILTKKPGK